MTYFPHSALQERRRKLLKAVGMTSSGLMVLTVLVIFGLIVRSERAHDETRCPFAPGEVRQRSADVRVVEQVRRCLPEAEEHRWLVERAGAPRIEVARKRLDRERFSPQRFSWQLEEDARHLLVIKLLVDGALVSEFHEADAPERAR
jgi:hypothetical protein